MFITKKSYDKLNARIVDLARMLKDKEDELNYCKEENETLRNEKEEQHYALKEVIKLATTNRYSNPEAIIRKIKESAQTAINS